MIRRKSKEGDEKLIYDETADPVERSSAILRLAVDGYEEMEPFLVKLLHHDNYLLRGQAIKVLLGGWGQEKYLSDAVRMLHKDFDSGVKIDAAFSLGQFAGKFEDAQKYKMKVLKELIEQLQNDDDWTVQASCYEEALKIIKNKRFGIELPDYFERNRDVDWELLKPYMDQSKPHVQTT